MDASTIDSSRPTRTWPFYGLMYHTIQGISIRGRLGRSSYTVTPRDFAQHIQAMETRLESAPTTFRTSNIS
jgi:hypothetical protein